MEDFRVRRWWLVPQLLLLGAALGLTVGLLSSTARRAEVPVLITSPSAPAAVGPELPDVLELVKGSVLVGNVRSTLRLERSDAEVRKQLSARIRRGSHIIVVSATSPTSEKARQLAQEAGTVLAQLVKVRFADATPPLQASLFDSAHDVGAGDRHLARDILLGATAGLILGLLGAALLGGEAVSPGAGLASEDLGERERKLEQRDRLVGERERKLDQRVRVVGEREGTLEQRIRVVGERERSVARRAAELALTQREEPQAASPTVPADVSLETEPAIVEMPRGLDVTLNVNELEQFVQAHAEASPGRLEEWRTYLFYLRSHADADGRLPSAFGPLVAEVFGHEGDVS